LCTSLMTCVGSQLPLPPDPPPLPPPPFIPPLSPPNSGLPRVQLAMNPARAHTHKNAREVSCTAVSLLPQPQNRHSSNQVV
jgi:hypothetical protein